MQDTELYQQVVGLSAPWTVDAVGLDAGGIRVDVWLSHAADARSACARCGLLAPGHDRAVHANRAVDQVLPAEHKALMASGDTRLKGVRHIVRYNLDNLPSTIITSDRRAGGYRSLAGFKTAICFHYGDLDFYPRCRRDHQFNLWKLQILKP